MLGCLPLLTLLLSLQVFSQNAVEIDRALLSRALRLEIVANRALAQKQPDMFKRAYAASGNPDIELSRQAYMRSLAEFRGIAWTAGHESAAAYRFAVGETILEPGAVLHAALERIQAVSPDRLEPVSAVISIRNEKDAKVSQLKSRSVEELANAEFSLKAPAEEGKYSLVVELNDAKSGNLIAAARAGFWVVPNCRALLASLRQRTERQAMRNQSAAQAAWANTVLAIAERYSAAANSSLRSLTLSGSILAQSLAPFPEVELLDPPADLAWAQRTLTALEAGQDPAKGLSGWIPFGIRAHKDQTLRLAHVWWPQEKPAGFIVLIGDIFSHDRSWSSAKLGGFFALSPSVRPSPSGWSPETWADVGDWIASLALVSGIEQKPRFLIAYSRGTVDASQELVSNPTRYSASAIIAGSSDRPLTTLPKGFPPLMLVEGGKDAIVLPDELRRAGLIFQRRLPGAFEYFAMPNENHETVRDASLPRVLEFFSAVAAGTWKPSGTPVPSVPRLP